MKRRTKILSGAIIVGAVFTAAAVVVLMQPRGNNHPGYTPPPYQKILLDRFPISLDVLFKMDQPAQRTATLNSIKSGQTEQGALFLVPYPNYFHVAHSPATFKWYLYVGRPTAISFPVNTTMSILYDRGNATELINGTAIKVNLKAVFYLNYYIQITLDHCCINKTLFDEWNSAPSTTLYGTTSKFVPIKKDAVIGYTHNTEALDFIITDRSVSNYDTTMDAPWGLHDVNPYYYFTAAVRTELLSHYQAQYDAMKQSGLYVESRLDKNFTINEENRIFGTWFYKTGFFSLNASHHQYGWYGFDGGILNLLNVNKTESETFYKDKNTGLNFTASMIGMYYDARYATVAEYSPIGIKYMYLLQGDFQQGIVRLDNFTSNVRPGPIYMKYLLTSNGATMFNDTLQVDYYNTLVAAQGSFTQYNLTYSRIYVH